MICAAQGACDGVHKDADYIIDMLLVIMLPDTNGFGVLQNGIPHKL